ncbi:TetR/AcrR family transcriptional regulator C-terminal domain-containing protein [Pseudochrobactrum asaccharolyticum]|uniref:TetR family transcriptional regulator n=1 Tax=Pseudochrobactrum asaccharolyticum TaxID=354351 RepID=A0A366DLX2_9HYPH|nr:TetR/AcrR family transcriptional regulator C-terminal domain-containing protein [Pseudochrobactrum asaccharolyticum]RBO90935.1 TetR family transcriptional regulator [Pseudochrobactrum asaccharolyticum]
MVRWNRETVIAEALALLDEVGIDAVSTRRLAKQLGIEQPALYWHFRSKAALLAAMAEAAMEPHARAPLPTPADDWQIWFADNVRSFRHTLLLRRDGARLHAGTYPKPSDLDRIAHKIAFLTAAGISLEDAKMAMLAAGRFTVGSVLEEQADLGTSDIADHDQIGGAVNHEAAFEAGLRLIVRGLTMSIQ